MVGKGSLNHNSREFYAPNVDPSRSHLNVEFCKEDIRAVYHELFDAAQQRYNEKQTRSDRRIADYYTKISSSKQEKPFHEIVLQIGNKDDTGISSETADLARQCLEAYVRGFQARNRTLRMFSAHLHMDEATPYVHIDFVPYITGSKRGMDTRVSLKQALAQMGFCGRNAQRYRVESLGATGKAGAGGYHAGAWHRMGAARHPRRALVCIGVQKTGAQQGGQGTGFGHCAETHRSGKDRGYLQAVQKQAVDLDKIEAVSAKKALLSDRVTLPRSDFENLLHAAKQYVVYRRQDEQLQKLLDAAQEKIRQLESVMNSLKEKVADLTNRLGEQTARYRQALMWERARRMQMEKENTRLKREKAGMMALLHKHGIAWKEPPLERAKEELNIR